MSEQDNNCPSCQAANTDDAATCENCGATLGHTMPIASRRRKPTPDSADTLVEHQIDDSAEATRPAVNPAFHTKRIRIDPKEDGNLRYGIVRLDGDLLLKETGTNTEFRIPSEVLKGGAVIGRYDTSREYAPTVDLEKVNGHQAGVSRLHATLSWQDDVLHLVDHDSTNGTFLNGRRLVPGQKRVIRDGDVIGFSRIEVEVRFERTIPKSRNI